MGKALGRTLYIVMPPWENNDQDITDLLDSKEYCFHNFEQAKEKYIDIYYEKQSWSDDVRILKINATYNFEDLNIWELDK